MGDMIKQADFSATQLATIKRTVAKDANAEEFDLFMNMARSYGLDPFRKQLHIIIYNKDNPQKRNHAIFPSRDGFRVIASRQGDYRPASEKSDIEYDESLKSPVNPLGIVSATVKLWKQDKMTREWFPVIGEAYWDEFAKISDDWQYDPEKGKRAPTGKKCVTGNWATMGRVMIVKCAEGQALRAGWPDAFGGLYHEEELRNPDEPSFKDITPSDAVEREEMHQRQNRLGDRAIMMVMDSTGVLQRVPIGELFDRSVEFIKASTADEVYRWKLTNQVSLQEFWAAQPGDALELKREIEKATASIGQPK